MNHKNLFRIAFLIGFPTAFVFGQEIEKDSIPFFDQLKVQYNNERDFKNNFYYNPASKSDYSNSSFSEVNIGIKNASEKVYRDVMGKNASSYGLETSSYQSNSKTLSLWGAASYKNTKIKSLRFNETLDYDRISPYSVADSVASNLEVEQYHFLGGFSKKIKRFTIGLEGDYSAQLGARSKDPRNKTITSDLKVKFGTNYNFYKELEVGAFVEVDKYTQNNSIKFVSILGSPVVYQMNGFGYYNYLFSGGAQVGGSSIETIYEQLGYEVGGQISNKKGKDFYIIGKFGSQNLTKATKGIVSSFYDTTEVEDKQYLLEGAKFFSINPKQRIGIKLQYSYKKRLGSEYGYSNNTAVLEQVYKQKTFKRDDTTYRGELFYQLNASNVSFAIMPYLVYQEFVEKRLRPFNGEKWDAFTIGASVDLKIKLAEGNVFTLQPYISQKSVSNHISALNLGANNSINNWVESDYAFLSSNVTQFGSSFRYDLKLNKTPGFYVAFDWQNAKILEKNNNYTGFKIGVTF